MFSKTYYLEFERYKSLKKCKTKHFLGHSNTVITVPFWTSILKIVDETTEKIEEERNCMAYLKRIKRIY